MKFNLSYIYIFVFLFSCTQDMKIMKKTSKIVQPTYSSKGFALIYEDKLYEQKVVNRKIKNDQLVITSNRKKTHIKDSPIITHVITKDDISKTSCSTVDELIEFAIPNIQSTHDHHGEDKIKMHT